MADFSIPITTPTDKDAELLAALRWHYGQVDDGQGGMREQTPAELRELIASGVRNGMKGIFKRHKDYLKQQAEFDDQIEITE